MNGSSKLVFKGAERRQVIIDTCRSARRRLILSIFRCDDFGIITEITDAVQRGVAVQVLMSRDARNWKKRLQRLAELLESAGAQVFRYSGPFPKYHAKYVVADDAVALVSSSNLTHKCFKRTCDFMFVTDDDTIVAGLRHLFEHDSRSPEVQLEQIPRRLIVGPEITRERFIHLLQNAKSTISIMDHRITDPGVLDVIEAGKNRGVKVRILGRGVIDGMISHGRMLVIDDQIGAIGSVAFSRPSLDSRREVAITIEEPELVRELRDFFEYCARHHVVPPPAAAAAAMDMDADDDEDGDDAD